MKRIAKKVLQLDLLIQFVFWLALSVYYATSQGIGELQHIIMPALMIANGVLFAVFAYLMAKEVFLVKLIVFFFILMNTILTLTDQVGWLDYLILALNLVALVSFILTIIPAGKTDHHLSTEKENEQTGKNYKG